MVESGAGSILDSSESSRKSQKKKYSRKNIPLPTRHIVSYRMQNPAVPVVSMPVASVRTIHTCYVVNGYVSHVAHVSHTPSLAPKATYGALVEDNAFSMDSPSFYEVVMCSARPSMAMSSQPIYQSSPLYAVDDYVYM